jgi:type VI secretion system secreted protein VgrG
MSPTYSQAGRPLALKTPLGDDVLLLETLDGVEEVSALFRFRLGVLTAAPAAWTFDQLLGKSVTVSLQLSDGSTRCLNGIVSRLAQGGLASGAQGPATFVRYDLEVVPQLWLLTRSARSRIFQQLSVTDILKQVLTGLTVSWQTQGTYKPRDYCVQYRETDFAFASRLMQEEGIYYFFDHADGSHTLVVGDTAQSYLPVPGPTTVSYQTTEGGLHPDDRIKLWKKTQEVTPGKVTLWDHCFELPGQNLQATTSAAGAVTAGTVAHKLNAAGNTALEVYDYPGLYAQRFDGIDPGGGERPADVQNISPDADRTVAVRLKQELLAALRVEGEGNVRQLSAGHKFTLSDHFDGNGDYAVTRVEHHASQEGVFTTGKPSPLAYRGSFRCVPAAVAYATPMTTPRPVIAGPQSAVVVGPAGDDDIFTDKYGRVKVQFAWDRAGKKDADSSCWVRVGTFWAGKQWGGIHIPRIGQEVVVAFEEGDPDRPIVVGSVYNAEQMPPYTLPDNKTRSTLKSRSSPGGGVDDFNELRLEDKKGSEEVYFHAQKDFNRVVENNDTLKVGSDDSKTCPDGSQTIEVYKNRTETVKTGDETVTIEKGNRLVTVKTGNDTHVVETGNRVVTVTKGNDTFTVETGNRVVDVKKGNDTHTVETGNRETTVSTGNDTHTVSKGNRETTVSTGNDTHTISQGNRVVTVSTGNDTLTIKSGNHTIQVSAGASSLEAAQSITLKVGGNSIKIDTSGITLQGTVIKLTGQAQVQAQGPIVQVSADGQLTLKGGIVMIN